MQVVAAFDAMWSMAGIGRPTDSYQPAAARCSRNKSSGCSRARRAQEIGEQAMEAVARFAGLPTVDRRRTEQAGRVQPLQHACAVDVRHEGLAQRRAQLPQDAGAKKELARVGRPGAPAHPRPGIRRWRHPNLKGRCRSRNQPDSACRSRAIDASSNATRSSLRSLRATGCAAPRAPAVAGRAGAGIQPSPRC